MVLLFSVPKSGPRLEREFTVHCYASKYTDSNRARTCKICDSPDHIAREWYVPGWADEYRPTNERQPRQTRRKVPQLPTGGTPCSRQVPLRSWAPNSV